MISIVLYDQFHCQPRFHTIVSCALNQNREVSITISLLFYHFCYLGSLASGSSRFIKRKNKTLLSYFSLRGSLGNFEENQYATNGSPMRQCITYVKHSLDVFVRELLGNLSYVDRRSLIDLRFGEALSDKSAVTVDTTF